MLSFLMYKIIFSSGISQSIAFQFEATGFVLLPSDSNDSG